LSPPVPLVSLPADDPAPAALAPDPERAFAAQDASIEEFLSALEAAISADEAGTVQQDLDLESRNGQTAPDSPSQSHDSLSQTAADAVPDSQPDPVQLDQTIPVPPAEPEAALDLPQDQPPVKSEPGRARQQSDVLPWFIVFLAILAALLLFAIFVVLLIGAGLIPLVAI
jgi:hypothetical protein